VEFGEAMGLRDGPQTIENLGLTNPQAAGAAGDPEPVAEVLEIENGRPVRARHHDGSTSGVVLVKNHGPVVFGSDAQRITLDRVPWTGELKVQDGVLKFDPKDDVEKELAKKLKISAGMIEIGQDVTATAFANALGGFGRFIVTITVILFALSTAISWSYYGDRCTEFLFGIRGVIVYKLVFLGFVYLGAVLPLETVWTFGDVALGLMTVPNLIAIVFLSGKVRRMQDEYFDELKQNP
jgi:AGCS family alanine or glycine:cation symporter